MPVMRIVLLLLLVGGLSLFAFSNLSPMLSLVFLGMRTPVLPLATWIGIAIAAGAVTSFFLQLLSYLPRGSSRRRFEQSDEAPRSRSARRETPQTSEPEPQIPYTSPPPSPETPRNDTASDWEEGSDQNWNFDEEPVVPKSSQKDFNRESPRNTPQTEYTSAEAKSDPKTSSQTGSVYSYSYREQDKKQSGVGKPDVVYDANYRVIMPPYQKPPEPEADDDDWGFEDDEDFDQGKHPPKRR